MATYRKPLKDINGNFIIPAMTGDQTEWVQTGDIADGAVTSEKLSRSNPASYSVNTIYVNNAGASANFFRMGSLVVVNINLNMKAGTVPSGTALITGLPPCNMGGRSGSSMAGTNGSGVRLQILENGTSIVADGAFTATAQWYNGQITYMSY